MRRLLLLLLAAQLLAAALSEVPEGEPTLPEPTPAVTLAPEKGDDLPAVLQRIILEYDPYAGSVGAIRWAEKLLEAWEGSGEDAAAARTAAERVEREALAERLPRLQWAAEKLCSGADLGLMNEPGHKTDWTGTDAESLFAALYEGAGLSADSE